MKKITLSVAALLTAGGLFAQSPRVIDNYNYVETVNTLEDLMEWINSDIQEGKIDSISGVDYIANINEILSRLEDLPDAPKSKSNSTICLGTTKAGKNCKNKTTNESGYCHLHECENCDEIE